MTAFDTDILTDIAKRVPQVMARVASVSPNERFLPIVVAEEALRGQLASVRLAQAGKAGASHLSEHMHTWRRLFVRSRIFSYCHTQL